MMKKNETLLQLSLLTLLATCGTSAVAVDDASADYESKIKAALENYAAHSDEILQRAIEVGNNDGAAAIDNVEIDANGDIISLSSSAEVYADFGLKAVNAQLHKIHKLIEQYDLHHEYKEIFWELTAQNGAGSTTIPYEQLQEWDEIAPILDKLYDKEFLNLWQKAIGSESHEGEMTLSQFVKFNDLLDNLVMAKVDFKALTKRLGKPEIPYYRLYKWPALSEDMSEKDFFALWKKALGEDVVKGVMNYKQFLVFYDIAEKWLERDINDVVEEEQERRGNYWVKSGNNKEDTDDSNDDDEEDDDGGYDLQNDGRPSYYIADEDLPDDIRSGLESDEVDIRNEAEWRRKLDPEMWEQFSYWEIHAYFGCEKAFDSPRPLWTDQQWKDIRDFYHEFIDEDMNDGDGPYKKVRSYQFSEDEVDFSQSFIPFQSGEKGRGLQAARDIKAGELVFKATNNTIVFNYGHTWRKMLFAVYERFADPGLTCDLHVWSWVQDLYDGGPMKVFMDLDSGSLLNEGRDEPGSAWEPPNVQCGKPDAIRCDMDYYAFRDIKEGDELLIDYREFAFLDAWPAMGL
eukprot:scaffold5513_cov141-Skeletonema_menzelii.AAC.2